MPGFKKIILNILIFFKKFCLSFLVLVYFIFNFKNKKRLFQAIEKEGDKRLKITILHWNRLGDALLLTPTLKAVKKKLPYSILTVVIKDKGALEVLKNNPYIDNLQFLDSWFLVLKFIIKNRKQKASILLDLSLVHFYHSFIFRLFFKSKFRIGLENHQKIGFFKLNNFNKLYDKVVKYNQSTPYLADYFLSSLRLINIINTNNELDFFPVINSNDYINFKIPSYPYILIHPGTRNLENAYLNWDKVIDKIISTYNDYNIVIAGQVKDFNTIKFPYEKIKSRYKKIYFIQNTSLSQLSKLIDNTSLFLGLDSGIAHLAVARKVNTIVIFGRADFKMYAPERENIEAVYSKDIDYPYFHFYDFFSHSKSLGACTKKIKSEDILHNIQKLLTN